MARHGNLRASDSDRDEIIDRLRTAATEGRLAAEELEQRVQAALIALTYDELDATVADLPGPRARRGREPQRRTVGGRALATARAYPIAVVVALPFIAAIAAMVVAVTVMWMVLMCVVLLLGGRSRGRFGPPPWVVAQRHATRQVRHATRQARRSTRSYWA
jgi:hypothetical protein